MNPEDTVGYLQVATLAESEDICDAAWSLYYDVRIAEEGVPRGEHFQDDWEQTNRYIDPLTDPSGAATGVLVPVTARMRDEWDGVQAQLPPRGAPARLGDRADRAARARRVAGVDGAARNRSVAVIGAGAVPFEQLSAEWQAALNPPEPTP